MNRARAVVLSGLVSVSAGIWVGAGAAWGMAASGAAAVAWGLLFMDVEPDAGQVRGPDDQPPA